MFDRVVSKIPSRAEARVILESLKMPTLLILGKLDYAVPHIAWEEIIHDLPHLTYVLLEKHGHNPQTEFPEEFDQRLTSWFQHQV